MSKIYTMEQGSPEWEEIRRGIPTASEFSRIITAKQRKFSTQADGYIRQLIGQKYSKIPPEGIENYTNKAMRWGKFAETEARNFFSFETNLDPVKVGFVTTDDGRFGCSPDSLIALPTKSGLELKCPQSDAQMEYLDAGVLPPEHMAQVHGGMIVCECREWWFMSYSLGLPPLILKVEWDSFTDELQVALEMFHERFQAALDKFKATYPDFVV